MCETTCDGAMRAVDTNVLVRLLTRDDEVQARAAEAWVSTAGQVWVSHVVLVECIWVLEAVYARTHAQLVAAVETLLDHQTIVLEDSAAVAAALVAFRGRASPGFSDCLVLALAQRAGHLLLATFDRRLGRLDGAVRIGPKRP